MKKVRFKDTEVSEAIAELVAKVDHRALGTWAADCAERVLPLFEREHPLDDRPRQAITDLREWVRTGTFHMADVRRSSLSAHAAARGAEENGPARFAARACGQAMATTHASAHSIAAAIYAAKAVWAADPGNATENVFREREWQYRRLLELQNSSTPTEPS